MGVSRKLSNRQRAQAVLQAHYAEALTLPQNQGAQRYDASTLASSLIEALLTGKASLEGPAVRMLCRELGVPRHPRRLREFLQS